MQQGRINVTSENIFPIIKKFLYSDHEIFLREIVSNAVDATQKIKTFASVGEFKNELGDLTVRVNVDKKKGTITVTDRGIGMTLDEINKYINEIAFSSAEEFLDKYKDKAQAIIGHFGLGFYSAFMVSKKVEIITKSHKEGSKAIKWMCEGNPEFKIEETEKTDRGTDIIMYIDDENKDFLEDHKIQELLKKYCRYLSIPIAFGKEKEWKEGKEIETDKDNVVNDVNPLWTKNPSDLKKEDYDKFYSDLYPMADDALFYIHLFVDYPFKLTGVLYFPKVKSNVELQKNKIQLYCNQVFVTDSVEGIVPDFLTLMHGVIDSPDIPLNISRSYLQSDSNVKKISSHISKKVADKLADLFKNDRKDFESKWDSLKIFIEYGMLTDDKFYERAESFLLLKNTDGKYFTLEEYKNIIKDNQEDKNKSLIYLYSTNIVEQHSYIENAKSKGYDVLEMTSHLNAHFINFIEQKLKDSRFVRVDAEVIDKLIQKEDKKDSVSNEVRNDLTPVFEAQLPKEKGNFIIMFESLGENYEPITITQSEFMRRMKDMAAVGGGGFNLYGSLPDSYNYVVNINHPLVKKIESDKNQSLSANLSEIDTEIKPFQQQLDELKNKTKDKKDEEIPQSEKDQISDLQKKLDAINEKRNNLLKEFGTKHVILKQLTDLALLANNMLKGQDLTNFVKRSVELIK